MQPIVLKGNMQDKANWVRAKHKDYDIVEVFGDAKVCRDSKTGAKVAFYPPVYPAHLMDLKDIARRQGVHFNRLSNSIHKLPDGIFNPLMTSAINKFLVTPRSLLVCVRTPDTDQLLTHLAARNNLTIAYL